MKCQQNSGEQHAALAVFLGRWRPKGQWLPLCDRVAHREDE